MKRRYLVYITISLLLSALNLYVSESRMYSGILLGILLIFSFLFLDVKRNNFKETIKRTYEAINFISSFIITLSVNGSLLNAYKSATTNVSKELKSYIDQCENLRLDERIEYLYKYFKVQIYGVFINIMKQYIYNGGDVIKISQLLLRDSRNLEDRINEYEVQIKRKSVEFFISWGLTIVILVAMNLSLANLNTKPSSYAFFAPLVFVFFILFLLNYTLVILKIYDDSFIAKGVIENDEKVQRRNTFFKSKSNN